MEDRAAESVGGFALLKHGNAGISPSVIGGHGFCQGQASAFALAWQHVSVPLMRGHYLFPKAHASAEMG